MIEVTEEDADDRTKWKLEMENPLNIATLTGEAKSRRRVYYFCKEVNAKILSCVCFVILKPISLLRSSDAVNWF